MHLMIDEFSVSVVVFCRRSRQKSFFYFLDISLRKGFTVDGVTDVLA